MDQKVQSVRMLIATDALFYLLPVIIKLLIVGNALDANPMVGHDCTTLRGIIGRGRSRGRI